MVEHFKKVASGMTNYPPDASVKKIAIPDELLARLAALSQAQTPDAASAGKKKASLRVSSVAEKSVAEKPRFKTLPARARKPPPITTEENDVGCATSLPPSRRASSLAMRRSVSLESGPLGASAVLTFAPPLATPSDASAKPSTSIKGGSNVRNERTAAAKSSTSIKDLWRSVQQEWVRPGGGPTLTRPTVKRVASFLLEGEAATRPPATRQQKYREDLAGPDPPRVGKGLQLGQDALTSCASWVGVPKTTLSAHARSRAPGSWSPRVRSSREPAAKVASDVARRAGHVVRFEDSSFSPVNVVWGRRVGSG